MNKTKITGDERVSGTVIAKCTGLTGQRIGQLASEGRIPKNTNGGHKLAKTILALFRHERQKTSGKSPELADAKQRKEIAEADGAEVDTAKKTGEVVSADDARLVWMDRALEVRRLVEACDYLKPTQKTRLIADLGKIKIAEIEVNESTS